MPVIERQVALPTDVERAWDLLTSAEELERWLGAEVDLRPTPGAAGLVVDDDGTRRRLVVDEVVPGQRLTWHWAVEEAGGAVGAVSRVALTLTPEEDGGTRLVVTEEPLEQAAAPVAQASASAGGAAWSHRLLHLEALLLVAAAIRG